MYVVLKNIFLFSKKTQEKNLYYSHNINLFKIIVNVTLNKEKSKHTSLVSLKLKSFLLMINACQIL